MKPKPDFRQEQHWLNAYPNGIVIGLDEAGRGPWAGPVMAGAAWISPDAVNDLPDGIADSKTLSEGSRKQIYRQLKDMAEDHTKLKLATAAVSAAEIDDIGILPATFRAMQMAADKLTLTHGRDYAVLLVDGSITPDLTTEAEHTHVEAVVKGDGHVLSIAVAAIMAKYDRDQEMMALAQEYPNYQWQNNKGYGTADHKSALDTYGVTPYHRKSFRPVARLLEE